MKVRSIKELLQALEATKDNIMEHEISEKVKSLMADNVETHVYKAYEPRDYVRTGQLKEDFDYFYDKGVLGVYSSRYDINNGYFVDIPRIIERGRGYSWGGNALDDFIGPRPFGAMTREDLGKHGLFRRYLVESLKAKGYKVI